MSPDCRDGNHQKCDGTAWDDDADEETTCECPHHTPQRISYNPRIERGRRDRGAEPWD
jgi:hypothetical protein